MTELSRLRKPVDLGDISRLLSSGAPHPGEAIGLSADLQPVIEYAQDHIERRGTHELEASLAPLFHGALMHLSRRSLLDPGLWNWLAIEPFRFYVIHRWHKGVVPDVTNPVSQSQYIRWMLRPSLRGYANHAIARLF